MLDNEFEGIDEFGPEILTDSLSSIYDAKDYPDLEVLTILQSGFRGIETHYNVSYKSVSFDGKRYWEFVDAEFSF